MPARIVVGRPLDGIACGGFEPGGGPAVDLDLEAPGVNLADVLILNQTVIGIHAHQKVAQPVAVGRGHQIHSFSEPPLHVQLYGIRFFGTRIGIGSSRPAIVKEQLEGAGIAKAATVEEFVCPAGRGLVNQGRPGRKKAVAVRGKVEADAEIQLPSIGELALILREQSE